MKKSILILALAATFVTVVIAGNYMFIGHKQDKNYRDAISKRGNLNSLTKDAKADDLNVKYVKEWGKFKKESQIKIKEQDSILAILSSKLVKRGELSDELHRKSVANLEQQINYMKDRLSDYEKSPGNWEAFKEGFNQEILLIGISLNDMMITLTEYKR